MNSNIAQNAWKMNGKGGGTLAASRGTRISLWKLRVKHHRGTSRERRFLPCGLTRPSAVHEFFKLLLGYGADEIRFLSGFDGPHAQETDYPAII